MNYVSYLIMKGWSSNLHYQKLNNELNAEYVSRIVAIIHAVLAFVMSGLNFFDGW